MENKICPYCESEFICDNPRKRYCSARCQTNYNKAQYRRTHRVTPIVDTDAHPICRYCQKPFTRRSNRHSRQIYCSSQCCNAFHYRGGTAPTDAPPPQLPPMPTATTPTTAKLLAMFYARYPKSISLPELKRAGLTTALTRLVSEGICAVLPSAKDNPAPRYVLAPSGFSRLAKWGQS